GAEGALGAAGAAAQPVGAAQPAVSGVPIPTNGGEQVQNVVGSNPDIDAVPGIPKGMVGYAGKLYDARQLLDEAGFGRISEPAFFDKVKADPKLAFALLRSGAMDRGTMNRKINFYFAGNGGGPAAGRFPPD